MQECTKAYETLSETAELNSQNIRSSVFPNMLYSNLQL